jgi:phosphate starvation-inducible protein PhoH and related proteins
VQKAFERHALEVAPLAFMRGRTLNHSFVILDEAQNTTPEQMKMLLTRLGAGSKAVITGDVSQIDLPKDQLSGLVQAQSVLEGVEGIAFTLFTSADVVRHPLVARIVDAYDASAQATPSLAKHKDMANILTHTKTKASGVSPVKATPRKKTLPRS